MQGDQIGRIIASPLERLFTLKIIEVAHSFGDFFPRYQLCIHFEKSGWAT
jgi:hypothetical protein